MGGNLRRIESPRNPEVREARALREKRARHRGLFLVEGPHLLEALLKEQALHKKGRTALLKVFLTASFRARYPGLMALLARTGAEEVEVTGRVLDYLATTESPQGVVGLASLKEPRLEDVALAGVTVVLDGLQDPGNVGAIIRTADAAGSDAVVLLEGTCDAYTDKALRATAGSIFHLPVIHARRKTIARELKERGLTLVAAHARAEASLFEAELPFPLAFVFGNEARGVSPALLEAAELALRLPIPGRAESLNVAASAAVFLYEAVRRGGRRQH
jgi:TrmH family RNA methyltransferase